MAGYRPMVEGTYRVSSGFGARWGTQHLGIDLAAPIGTPIYAVADGVVVQGRERPQGSVAGFGSWIWIDCQASVGRDFIYGHVHHPGILVQAGDRVHAGQQIGVVGNEGQSTGPHLHFEEWTAPGRLGGRAVDPAGWVASHPSPGATPPSPERSDHMTIFGIDISDHQRGFDLARAKAEGIEFAILRLCDGAYVDKAFREHLAGAERAGMLVSTYWYLRSPSEGTTIAQQVDVIDRQMNGRRDLGVWIDVESVTRTGRKLLTGNDVWAAKRELERRGYTVPGIYSGAWYWEHMPGGEPSMDGLGHLWVSNYGRNRRGSYRALYEGDGGSNHRGWSYPLGDRKPDILQYGSNGLVAGYAVDINAYRGTREQLAAIFTGKQPQKKEELSMQAEKEIRQILDQLVGDRRDENGNTLFGGWSEDSILQNARNREGGGVTLVELAALNRDELRRQSQTISELAGAVQQLATAIKEDHNA